MLRNIFGSLNGGISRGHLFIDIRDSKHSSVNEGGCAFKAQYISKEMCISKGNYTSSERFENGPI